MFVHPAARELMLGAAIFLQKRCRNASSMSVYVFYIALPAPLPPTHEAVDPHYSTVSITASSLDQLHKHPFALQCQLSPTITSIAHA